MGGSLLNELPDSNTALNEAAFSRRPLMSLVHSGGAGGAGGDGRRPKIELGPSGERTEKDFITKCLKPVYSVAAAQTFKVLRQGNRLHCNSLSHHWGLCLCVVSGGLLGFFHSDSEKCLLRLERMAH